jgi:hypothetical protein
MTSYMTIATGESLITNTVFSKVQHCLHMKCHMMAFFLNEPKRSVDVLTKRTTSYSIK